MAKKPRLPEDDDGRTIADMSGISGPSLYTFRRPKKTDESGESKGPPGPQNELTRKEKLMFMLGALKASLLIVSAYLVGMGLVILLLLFLWR